ncbi:MAG: filamentous hemagglutinin N-terminal domain-containing protein, partial [Leptolyngbyaceae cyanobacterium RU_5_1]|nr:filamentous hemagglutinin N-terminal domain-containing protein [Leptolyngbyaceae cyanobacterium RU_5_1]
PHLPTLPISPLPATASHSTENYSILWPLQIQRSRELAVQIRNRVPLALSISITLGLVNPTAHAQIIPDTTLPENSRVTPGCTTCTIEGGTTRGVNLFHSFKEFSVPTGGAAWFNNADQIQTIFTRVTGNSLSTIDGLLKANGTANLFVLNPNGIIFGPNARLQIGGSFLASTAPSFKFADGSEFSASNPQAPPLLTINVPVGLQYGRPVGNLQQAGNLAVPAGQSLTLYGNQVTNTGILTAIGGTVQVLGDRVSLLDQAAIEVSSSAGGGTVLIGGDFQGKGTTPTATQTLIGPNVTINANGISSSNSVLRPPSSALPSHGGKVVVWATDTTEFYGTINARGGTQGGDGGFVEVSGSKLTFQGRVDTTAAAGKTGTLLLDPDNITIGFTSTIPGDQLIAPATIATALNTNSVTLAATNAINVTGTVRANSPNDLTLQAKDIALINASLLQFGGGNIVLETTQNAGTPSQTTEGTSVSVNGGIIGTLVLAGATNTGGSVQITTGSLSVTRGARLIANTAGSGDAGSVKLNVSGAAIFDGVSPDGRILSAAGSTVNPGATGKGGSLELTAGSLTVTNGAQLTALTAGTGNAGSMKLTVRNAAIFDGASPDGRFLSGAFSQVSSGATGKGGSLELTTGSLTVTNGAQLNAGTFGSADAGNVKLIVRDVAIFDGITSDGRFASGAGSAVQPGAIGKGGSVELTAGSLSVTNGAQLSASTFGIGDAGNVKLTISGAAIFDGVSPDGRFSSAAESTVSSDAIGKGGSLELTAGSLTVTNGARLGAGTFGTGDAGNVKLTIRGTATFDGGSPKDNDRSGAFSTVGSGATGKGGNLELMAGSLTVTNGAFLSASTLGNGDAGNVKLTISDSAIFDGFSPDGRSLSSAFSTVDPGAIGNGGNVELTAGSLTVTNGAQLGAGTFGTGDAGNVKLTVRGTATFDGRSSNGRFPSGAFSTVEPGAIGNGGNVELTAGAFVVTNGAAISASTGGRGNGGNVIVRAESIRLANRAGLTATSSRQGDAGNIEVTADSIRLDNRAFISTATASGQGGDIVLRADQLVLLRRNSLITTTAGTAQAGGDGGNITINAPRGFIVGVLSENSDITANAFTGRGGNITINAQGIYGLQFQPRLTPFSDITASSQFGISGVVTLNTPDVDPNRGLLQLPVNPVDPSQQIDQSCVPGSRQSRGRFVITGRGGIPLSPDEPLQSQTVLADWVMLEETQGRGDTATRRGREEGGDGDVGEVERVGEARTNQSKIQNLQSKIPSQIIEATGLVTDPDGVIHLVAAVPTSPQIPRLPDTCP